MAGPSLMEAKCDNWLLKLIILYPGSGLEIILEFHLFPHYVKVQIK